MSEFDFSCYFKAVTGPVKMQNNAQIYTKVFRVFLVDVWVAVRVLKPCS